MRFTAIYAAAALGVLFVSPAAEAQKRFALTAENLPASLVSNPVFSPDSRILAVLHTGISGVSEPDLPRVELSRVSIWDVAMRQRIQSLECRNPGGSYLIPRLAFSPDGSRLALAEHDGALRLWNTSNWTDSTVTFPAPADEALPADVTPAARSECTAVAFSPDSRQFAMLATIHGKVDSYCVSFHDLQAGKTTPALPLEGQPAAVAWQPDDRLALVVNIAGGRRSAHSEVQEWALRSAGSGEIRPVLARRQKLAERPAIAAFAPTAQSLAFAMGSQIALFNVRSGEVRQLGTFGDYFGSRVPNYRAGATALAFSADGATLAAGGNASKTHTRLRFFALRGQTFDFDSDAFDHGPGYAVTNIALAPSGDYVATAVLRWAGSGEPLFLWALRTKRD